eukprot:403330976
MPQIQSPNDNLLQISLKNENKTEIDHLLKVQNDQSSENQRDQIQIDSSSKRQLRDRFFSNHTLMQSYFHLDSQNQQSQDGQTTVKFLLSPEAKAQLLEMDDQFPDSPMKRNKFSDGAIYESFKKINALSKHRQSVRENLNTNQNAYQLLLKSQESTDTRVGGPRGAGVSPWIQNQKGFKSQKYHNFTMGKRRSADFYQEQNTNDSKTKIPDFQIESLRQDSNNKYTIKSFKIGLSRSNASSLPKIEKQIFNQKYLDETLLDVQNNQESATPHNYMIKLDPNMNQQAKNIQNQHPISIRIMHNTSQLSGNRKNLNIESGTSHLKFSQGQKGLQNLLSKLQNQNYKNHEEKEAVKEQIAQYKRGMAQKVKLENLMSKQVYRQHLLKNIIEVKKRRQHSDFQKFSASDINDAINFSDNLTSPIHRLKIQMPLSPQQKRINQLQQQYDELQFQKQMQQYQQQNQQNEFNSKQADTQNYQQYQGKQFNIGRQQLHLQINSPKSDLILVSPFNSVRSSLQSNNQLQILSAINKQQQFSKRYSNQITPSKLQVLQQSLNKDLLGIQSQVQLQNQQKLESQDDQQRLQNKHQRFKSNNNIPLQHINSQSTKNGEQSLMSYKINSPTNNIKNMNHFSNLIGNNQQNSLGGIIISNNLHQKGQVPGQYITPKSNKDRNKITHIDEKEAQMGELLRTGLQQKLLLNVDLMKLRRPQAIVNEQQVIEQVGQQNYDERGRENFLSDHQQVKRNISNKISIEIKF